MFDTCSVNGVFSGRGQIKTVTYKEQAYDLIKEAILYQKFQPDAIYSQEAICQELGISRTPVREALLELQKEGYIVFCRGKGIQIVSLDDKAIHDILETRLYHEMAVAELAAKRATAEDLAEIGGCLEEQRRNLDAQDIDLCYHLDHRFHRAIAKAAHNERLMRAVDDILNHYLRFEELAIYKNYNGASAIMTEHTLLYEAIRDHDPEKACAAARDHLCSAYDRTLGRYWGRE